MTISSENFKSGPYDGNDVATSFSYNFKIFEDTGIEVIKTDAAGAESVLVLDTDYTVSGVGDDAGGSVTYPISGTPLATGEKLTLRRKNPLTQLTDLRNQGAFLSENIEKAMDRVIMIIQQQQEIIDRAAILDDTTSYSSLSLPDPEASKYLMWKSDLTGFENVSSMPGSSYTVTSFMETVFDDGDKEEARATLDTEQKNYIVNGCCRVAQRQAESVTVSGDHRHFPLDNIYFYDATGLVTAGTLQQKTSGAIGSTGYSALISGLTSSGGSGPEVVIPIEAKDVSELSGMEITVSCKVKHNYPGNINYYITVYTPDAENDFTGASTLQSSTGVYIIPQNTERDLESTITVSDCSRGLIIKVEISDAYTFSSNDLEYADFKLEKGNKTSFVSRQYSHELMLCKRYYEHMLWDEVLAPYYIGTGYVAFSGKAKTYVKYEALKLLKPSITITGTSSDVLVDDGSTGSSVAASSLAATTDKGGFMLEVTPSGSLTNGNGCIVYVGNLLGPINIYIDASLM